MKNTCLLVDYSTKVLKVYASYKRIQDTASLPVPLFLVVLHRIRIYISRYHFYNFLGPNPTFSEKNIFVTNFNYLTDSPKPPPHPLTTKFC